MVRDADFCYSQGHCPSQNTSTKVKTQGLVVKESKLEESRPKNLKPINEKTPTPPHTKEPGKISCQDKKKKYFKKKRDQKNFTLAKGDNAIEGEKK